MTTQDVGWIEGERKAKEEQSEHEVRILRKGEEQVQRE